MKILVTGYRGYIGSHLCGLLEHNRVSFEGVDLKECNGRRDYCCLNGRDFDVVIHLAASVSVMESFDKPVDYFWNNALGLAPFLNHNKVKRFILVSTGGAMYGNARLAKEEDAAPEHCLSPYAQSKFLAERLVHHMCPDHVILRLGNVYGGNLSIRGEANVHAHFEQDDPIVLYGGSQTRDLIHVNDVCQAIMKAITVGHGTYNIGSGQETAISDIAEFYAHQRGVDIERRPARGGEVEYISLDITKAKRDGLL